MKIRVCNELNERLAEFIGFTYATTGRSLSAAQVIATALATEDIRCSMEPKAVYATRRDDAVYTIQGKHEPQLVYAALDAYLAAHPVPEMDDFAQEAIQARITEQRREIAAQMINVNRRQAKTAGYFCSAGAVMEE